MTKEDLSNTLSLSCIENYFLAYFKDKFDVSKLYLESYIPFNAVIDNFFNNNASYEHYPLIRVQDIAEKIGYTQHNLSKALNIEKNSLNLIRVNEKFFEGTKLTPWRADHYIAIKKNNYTIQYSNNYPLSCGEMTIERLLEIYDGASINYSLCSKKINYIKFNFKPNLATKVMITEKNISEIRGAILVLKTIRKRIFNLFGALQGELIVCYENMLIAIELQNLRHKIDINVLQNKLDEIVELENSLTKKIQENLL